MKRLTDRRLSYAALFIATSLVVGCGDSAKSSGKGGAGGGLTTGGGGNAGSGGLGSTATGGGGGAGTTMGGSGGNAGSGGLGTAGTGGGGGAGTTMGGSGGGASGGTGGAAWSINPGTWSGSSVSFNVSSSGTSITRTDSTLSYGGSLLVSASFGAIGSCSSASTTKIVTSTVAITNNKFSYSGTDLTVSGTFSSATQASGTFKLTASLSSCGVSSATVSGNWTATWKAPQVVPDAGPDVPGVEARPEVPGADAADASNRDSAGSDVTDALPDLPTVDPDTRAVDAEAPALDAGAAAIDGV
jgi:hypothetical protein